MKIYSPIFAVVFIVVGCSSSNEKSPIGDTGKATGVGTFDVDENLRMALSVVNTEHLKRAIDLVPFPTTDDFYTLVDADFTDGVRTWKCPISGAIDVASGGEGNREYKDCVTDVGQFDGKYRQAKL